MTPHGFRAMARTILDEGVGTVSTGLNTSWRMQCVMPMDAHITALLTSKVALK